MTATRGSHATGIFHLVMIKPSHYDDDGYPIQWIRSAIPSNTLACLNGLGLDAQRRAILGPDVEIRLHTYDETNRRVRPDRIISVIERAGGKALIALVGVQSNQFPRAVDLARPFIAAGCQVAIGGFHVSGCLAMLPDMPPELRDAQALGITLFAGEAEEGRLDAVIRDAWAGTLAPLYNFMDDLPSLQGEPPPILPRKHVRRTRGRCRVSISGVAVRPMLVLHDHQRAGAQEPVSLAGRPGTDRSARTSPRDIKRFFITDDNFARNRDWEPLFDR